jgi:hypothetical protein
MVAAIRTTALVQRVRGQSRVALYPADGLQDQLIEGCGERKVQEVLYRIRSPNRVQRMCVSQAKLRSEESGE